MIEIMPYYVPNFWTERNAAAKLRQMERRGMPNLAGGRFVTLTVNQANYEDEEKAYEEGSDRIRRMLTILKRKYKIRRWFWKLEFHKPDAVGRQFAHWHMWFDYGGNIPGEELTRAWSLGRTDIKKVRNKDWRYLFKYICKDADDLPDWVACRERMRLFQTSMGFFAGNDEDEAGTPSPRQCDEVDETQNNDKPNIGTIGERLIRWTQYVVARSTTSEGVRHRLYHLQLDTWGALLCKFSNIRFACNIPADECEITTHKIRTTWLTKLPPCLQGST